MINLFFQLDKSSPSGLTWKESSPPAKRGDVVGTVNRVGYWQTSLKGKRYRVHRIVALLSGIITEEEFKDPDVYVDHIDGNRANNNVSNLRKSNNRENQGNQRVHREGRLVGATPSHRKGYPWRSQIKVNGDSIFLGNFKTETEAHEAYMKMKESMNGN